MSELFDRQTQIKIMTARFLNDVAEELDRARAKFPRNTVMYMALAKEFGELGNALMEHRGFINRAIGQEQDLTDQDDSSTRHVWDEAVQTAAMALRVAVEGDSSIPEYEPTYEIISAVDIPTPLDGCAVWRVKRKQPGSPAGLVAICDDHLKELRLKPNANIIEIDVIPDDEVIECEHCEDT